MRIITVLLLALAISACASKPSLEELEEQAMVSGDWAAVEHREEMVKNRRLKSAPHCPRGQTKVCVENGSGIDCYCAQPVGGR